MGILMTLICSTILLSTIVTYQRSLKQIQRRSLSYLCLKHYIVKSKSYVKQIATLNLAIQAANAASIIPAATVYAQKVVKMLKVTQDILHIAYIGSLLTTRRCSPIHHTLLLGKLPYQTKGALKLKRRALGTTILRRKQWQLKLFTQDGYFIETEARLKDIYSINLRVKSREAPFLRPFFGSLSL